MVLLGRVRVTRVLPAAARLYPDGGREPAGGCPFPEHSRERDKEDRMRRVLIGLGVAGLLFGGMEAASADPSVTVCRSVKVTVNGQAVVDDAGCTVAPPEE